MARVVEVTVPPRLTEELLVQLEELPLVTGVQLHRSASVKPPGDVLVVQVPIRGLHPLLRLLAASGIGRDEGTSYTTSEPVALVDGTVAETLLSEGSDASWEEMHQILARESSMSINALLTMGVAGFLSAVGISTGAVHVVIASMVIAPGFEPLTRIALGLGAGGSAWWRGVVDTFKAYLALAIGAAIATVLLPLLGETPLARPGSYLQPGALVDYWSSNEPSSLLLSALAAGIGGILVATNRTVLTSGVMIGLALIPAATLAASGLVAGEFTIAGKALLRWSLDALLVVLASLLVFVWKRVTVQRRSAQM